MAGRNIYHAIILLMVLNGSVSADVSGWYNQDIGTSGGSAVGSAGGPIEVTADGADIWGTSDGFHFVYKKLSGDGEVAARIEDTGTGSNGWAKVGVMIRQSTDPGCKHAMMAVTAGEGGGAAFQWRPYAGAESSSVHDPVPLVWPPVWVALVRAANQIAGWYKFDDGEWILQGVTEIAMTDPVLIGLCATSHAQGEYRTFGISRAEHVGDVTGRPQNLPAYNPSPADGAQDVPTNAILTWSPGAGSASHQVYLGIDPEALQDLATKQRGDETFAPGLFEPGTTYYWLIAEVAADGTTVAGDIWSFTTVGSGSGPFGQSDPDLPSDSPAGGDGYMGIREVIDNGDIGDQGDCYDSLASGAGTIVDYTAPVLNISDGGGSGHFGNDDAFGVVTAGHRTHGGADCVSLLARGTIRIAPGQGGVYTFGVNSDDGFTLQFPGHDFFSAVNGEIVDFTGGAALRFYEGRSTADTLGLINLPAGDHSFRLTFHESYGGAAVEFFAAPGSHDTFDPGAFRLVGQPGGGTSTVPGFAGEVNMTASRPGGWTGGQIDSLQDAEQAVGQGMISGTNSYGSFTMVNHIDPDDGGTRGSFAGDLTFCNNTGSYDDDFAVKVTGWLDIPASGTYQIGFNSDDGASLRIPWQQWNSVVSDATGSASIADDGLFNDALTASSLTIGEIYLPAGRHKFEALMFDRSGGAFFELVTVPDDGVMRLLETGGAGVYPGVGGLPLVSPSYDVPQLPFNVVFTVEQGEGRVGPAGAPIGELPTFDIEGTFELRFEDDQSLGDDMARVSVVELDETVSGLVIADGEEYVEFEPVYVSTDSLDLEASGGTYNFLTGALDMEFAFIDAFPGMPEWGMVEAVVRSGEPSYLDLATGTWQISATTEFVLGGIIMLAIKGESGQVHPTDDQVRYGLIRLLKEIKRSGTFWEEANKCDCRPACINAALIVLEQWWLKSFLIEFTKAIIDGIFQALAPEGKLAQRVMDAISTTIKAALDQGGFTMISKDLNEEGEEPDMATVLLSNKNKDCQVSWIISYNKGTREVTAMFFCQCCKDGHGRGAECACEKTKCAISVSYKAKADGSPAQRGIYEVKDLNTGRVLSY